MRAPLRVLPLFLLVLSLAALFIAPRRGQGLPLYAARNGLMCQSCHFDPNGGGPRNDFGFAFARNRHMLTPEDSTSHWKDLNLTNRVGENLPLYFGVNQRFMLLANQRSGETELERLGFFNMESAIHIAFQPHDRLTLVYSLDGFAQGPVNNVRSKEAFGLLGGQGAPMYLKVGRFRNPFGLRMDDHTVATRAGFGDLGTGGSYLPYDPRYPDMGVEFGGDWKGIYGRAAVMNGPSSALAAAGNTRIDAYSAKFGYNTSWYQGAFSLYEQPAHGTFTHSQRWAYAALTHYRSFAFLGEIGAGTDQIPFMDGKVNLLAGFAELDYAPLRWVNVRARYDRQELDRGRGEAIRTDNTFTRYSLEGEVVPVPFAELRWGFRYLEPKSPVVPIERQGFLQAHFAY